RGPGAPVRDGGRARDGRLDRVRDGTDDRAARFRAGAAGGTPVHRALVRHRAQRRPVRQRGRYLRRAGRVPEEAQADLMSEEIARARALLSVGRGEQAQEELSRLLARAPESVAALRDAYRSVRQARLIAPEEPEVHIAAGRFYHAISDPAAARRCYQRTLALDPHNGTARNNLAVVELRQGRPTRAGERLRDVLAERPKIGRA